MKSRQVFFDHAESHSAAWVNTWARMSPFFSASFKDIDQVYRAFQERPAATIAKAGIVLTLPTIANYAANLAADQFLDDKDKYGNVDEWVRRGYWVLPPINGDRIKIKKPYVGAFPFATVPEMFLDWAVKNDPRAFHDALGTFVDEVTPYNVMTPTVLQPVKEQYANKAFGRPLIKASLEKDSGPVKAERLLSELLPEEYYQACRELYNDDERFHTNLKLLYIWRKPNDIWQPPTREAGNSPEGDPSQPLGEAPLPQVATAPQEQQHGRVLHPKGS